MCAEHACFCSVDCNQIPAFQGIYLRDQNKERRKTHGENGKDGQISQNTLKKQRQKARIKEEPVRLAEAHQKDSERKKKSRQARKEYLVHRPLLRRQKREKKGLR